MAVSASTKASVRGGGAKGKKVLTVAVEVSEPTGIGRCRMAPLADASAESLHAFAADHVEPGATVITDGWQGYRGLDQCACPGERYPCKEASTL